MKSKTKFLIGFLSLAIVALSIFTTRLYLSQRDMEKSLVTTNVSNVTTTKNNLVPAMYSTAFMPDTDDNNFVTAAEKTVDAVVHIRTEIVRKGNSYYDFFGPLIEHFYGERMEIPNSVSIGYGSGVVISPDGYIVTNNHVVEGANKIEVTFNDKHKRTATVISNDPSTDLALIKVDCTNCCYLTFADSDKVRVGEWVLAVGNPFNLTSTVTAGIVSAKARNINILGDGSMIESFIQTDAAINPGNSGGALVNMNGDLVGINAAIASRTGGYEGYSFAIPSNIVKKVVEDFFQYGSLQRAYLGVGVTDITEELAKEKGIDEMSGVYISKVEDTGGAKDAGIKEGDILLSINDITVNTYSQLIGIVIQYRPGDKVKVKILRKKEIMEMEVVLKNVDGTEEIIKENDSFYNKELGIMVQPLSSSLKNKLGIDYGLKIVEVKEGVFMQKGIDNDFIILSVNNQRVNSEKDLTKALNSSKNGKTRIEGTNSTGSYDITFEFYR